jgi:hypothetical protein
LFERYIHAPRGHRLADIIRWFRDITSLPNVVGTIDGTHIPLTQRPSIHLTPMPSDFFNRKKFHSIFVQAVCDSERFFWNVCAGQPGGLHDAGQFGWSSIYTQLRRSDILPNPILDIGGVEVRPYLIGDSAYLSRPYLLKNFKPNVTDPAFSDKKRFDQSMNYGRVVIEQAFGALKNRWRILKGFNMGVDRAATVTLACCVLHNFCEIHSEDVPLPTDMEHHRDPYVGLRRGAMRLAGDGQAGKVASEMMRAALFQSWVERNPAL